MWKARRYEYLLQRNGALLSILIPAFNAATYLSTTLDSLLAQEGEDFEVVICDDGSSDQTGNIASSYANRDSRVRYFRQENSGASAARNAAFLAARGRWVIYFDADDLSYAGSLAAMMRVARLHPKDVVYCRWSKFDQHSDRRIAELFSGDMAGPLWLERAFLHDYPTYPGCFVLPRSLIEEAGGWNEQLSFQDDMEFYARVVSRVETMRFCPEAVFIYRQGVPGSISNAPGRGGSASQYLATTLAVRHLLSVRNTKSARVAGARQLMLVSYTQYLAAPDISRKAEIYAKSLAAYPRPWLPGGPKRRLLQVMLGWKLALKVHAMLKRLKQ